ncbi:CHAP domain-containing protein [Kitasatospora sp. NPDC017646]|uniref:CHAP domain-containing protein n=1 Tax=Kitasatospora sp. NPDC017646 TaxID=3364024 RepID=UPI003792F3AE
MSRFRTRLASSGAAVTLAASGLSLLAVPGAHAASLGDSIAGTALGQVGSNACGNGGAGYYAPGTDQNSSCSGGSRTHAWCADFAGWVWAQNGVKNMGILNDLANSFQTYAEKYDGGLSGTPHVGDAVFFHPGSFSGTDYDHVAIVTAVNADGTISWTGGNQGGYPGKVSTNTASGGVGTVVWQSGGYNVSIRGYASPVGGSVTPPPVTTPVGPQVTGVAPAAVYNPDNGTAEIFAIGTDGVLSHAYSTNGGQWSDWSTIDPSFHFTGKPTAVYNPATKTTEVFAIGTDGVLSHAYSTNSGQWSSWSTMDPGYHFTGSPTAVYNPSVNAVELFAIGTDGKLNHKYYAGGAWSVWNTMGNWTFIGSPTAVYEPDLNTVEVFAIGTDGVLSHSYSTSGAPWSDFFTLDTSYRFTGAPAVVYNPNNKTAEVFAVGAADGVMSHAYSTSGGQWSGWSTLDAGYKFAGVPTAVYNSTTKAVELFGTGADGVVNHKYFLGNSWSGWEALGNWKFAGAPVALNEPNTNAAEVFAIGQDGTIGHAYTSNGSPFSSWYAVGTWKFTTH